MDDKSKTRNDFRQILLEQLAHNEVESDKIRQFVISSALHTSDLFDSYQVNELLEAIEPDTLDWSVSYFDLQRKLAQSNFSEKRICHLIDVREYLIQNGIAGFAKALTAKPYYETYIMHTEANSTDFTPSDNLKKMVQQGTISLVRSALINELENNRLEDTEIDHAVAWTLGQVADLFVGYEENSLAGKMVNDPAQWDANYYDLQTSYINSNFSKNRFEHLILVRNALRQRGVKGFERIIITRLKTQQQPGLHTSSRPYAESPSTSSQPGFLRIALMAGGALAMLAALVISLL